MLNFNKLFVALCSCFLFNKDTKRNKKGEKNEENFFITDNNANSNYLR